MDLSTNYRGHRISVWKVCTVYDRDSDKTVYEISVPWYKSIWYVIRHAKNAIDERIRKQETFVRLHMDQYKVSTPQDNNES
jgi:hypothetical protein